MNTERIYKHVYLYSAQEKGRKSTTKKSINPELVIQFPQKKIGLQIPAKHAAFLCTACLSHIRRVRCCDRNFFS